MKRDGLASVVLFCLGAAILISGVLLAYARHAHRAQFGIVQDLISERDELEVEWGALQLERATTMGYLRIDREARERLGMREPGRQDIVFLRLHSAGRQSARSDTAEP
ncbi:cell division protein FtsL [Candidatus Foliamicus sp.]